MILSGTFLLYFIQMQLFIHPLVHVITMFIMERMPFLSQNLYAKWVFDKFSNIEFFIDLHSAGQEILYSWGDDDDQTGDPSMNFQNASYNGQRGITDTLGDISSPEYKEYIPASDLD